MTVPRGICSAGRACKDDTTQQIASALSSIKLSYASSYTASIETPAPAPGNRQHDGHLLQEEPAYDVGIVGRHLRILLSRAVPGDERIYPTSVADAPQKNFDIIDTFMTADYTDSFRLVAGLTKDPMIREDNESCFEPSAWTGPILSTRTCRG